MSSYTLAPVEQALVMYLRTVTGEHVGTKIPSPRPATFVRLSRMGGGRRNLVQSTPTLLVEVWGSEDPPTSPWPLTKQVWEALAGADEVDLPLGVEVMRSSITEPANYPDEATGSPRYTFIFSPTINLNP